VGLNFYDGIGRLLNLKRSCNAKTVTNPDNKPTTYTYDAAGRVTSVTDPLTYATSYAYDRAGRLRRLTDAKLQATTFDYTPLGRVRSETRPGGGGMSYTYNAAGKIATRTDALGQTLEYGYNDVGQLETLTAYDAQGAQTRQTTFGYDRAGNLKSYADCTDARPCVSTTYRYDAFNRKIEETVTYPSTLSGGEGFSKTLRYTYLPNGLKRTFTGPDGVTVSYAYDAADNLTGVRLPGAGTVAIPSHTMGRPDSVTTPGGQQTFEYDRLLRLKQRTVPSAGSGQAGASTAYDYDKLSNILTTTDTHGTTTYEYDWLSRLTSATSTSLSTGSSNEAWTYDPVGNRLSSADVGDVIAHNERNERNERNELRVYGNLTFSYDAQGNQTDRRENGAVVQRFIYDADNRLVRVEDGMGGVIAEYDYDPFGRRLWKEVNGERTYFFYADEGLIAEFDETGNEIRSYGWQPDATWGTNPLYLKQNGVYYWYRNDHLGTPQALVDSSGNVVWQATYTAFGNATIQVETVENNLRFPGQYYDAETGLHYNFHRYYDPLTGRYTQPDPIGFAGGDVNWYAYVGNDPINWIDPLGLLLEAEIGLWGKIAATLAKIEAILAALNAVRIPVMNPVIAGGVVVGAIVFYPSDILPEPPIPFPTEYDACPNPAFDTTYPGVPSYEDYINYATTGKNDKHANEDAKEAARKAYEAKKQEVKQLRSKPNKTPDDNDLLDRLLKQLKHLKDKMDWTGETHHRKP